MSKIYQEFHFSLAFLDLRNSIAGFCLLATAHPSGVIFSSFTPFKSAPYYSRSFMNCTLPYLAAVCIEVSELSDAAYRAFPPYSNLRKLKCTATAAINRADHVSNIKVNNKLPAHIQVLIDQDQSHFPKNNAQPPHSSDAGQWQKHLQFPSSWTVDQNNAYRISTVILST